MDQSWLEDSFLQLLLSPVWKFHIQNFIDENCLIFDDDEENKLPYTDIHRKYKTAIEEMLDEYMDDFGITLTQLMEACSSGLAHKHKNHFKYLLAVGDFLLFKSIMVERNIELCKEVESYVEKQHNRPVDESKQSFDSYKMEKSKYEHDYQEAVERSILDQSMSDDDRFQMVLQLAKQESLKTFKEEENLRKVSLEELVNEQLEETDSEEDEPLSTDNSNEKQNRTEIPSELPKLVSKHHVSTCTVDNDTDDAATQWIKSAMKESDQCTLVTPTRTEPSKSTEDSLIRDRAIYLNKRRTMMQEQKQKRQQELDKYKQMKGKK